MTVLNPNIDVKKPSCTSVEDFLIDFELFLDQTLSLIDKPILKFAKAVIDSSRHFVFLAVTHTKIIRN